MDQLDRAVIHALRIDARAPFTKIAAVLGTSTQTVVRRYRRLGAEAGLRVIGLPDPASARRQQWIVRLTATANAANDIAVALARRPDTSWVRLTSGGTEIVAIVHTTPGGTDAHALLLRDIPRTSAITAADRPLLAALARDGRASYADLAAATGLSASTVTRRVEGLRASGALFFDVELDDARFGITTSALLWMSVKPAHLDRVATTLAGHRELAVVAATTGPTNLLASALCPDTEALHHYLTTRLAMDSITAIETAPILRVLKAAGPLS